MKNTMIANEQHLELLIDKQKIDPVEWGDACQSWYLVDKENMGVFYEKMPPNTSDKLHLHSFSEQFLYVLIGTVGMEINRQSYYLTQGQGILIPKETPHRVFNDSKYEVEFILISGPNHPNDRMEIK